MAKKVLIISTSLRGGSNSDILANECAKGAKEAGHDVELLSLKGKDIKYCIGCLSCQRNGMCVLKDDVADIMAKVKDAEVIVYATPIYYYEMCGQMKTLLDRLNPLYSTDYSFRDIYMIATAAENDESAFEKAYNGLQGWVDCFEKASLKGMVGGGGIDAANIAANLLNPTLFFFIQRSSDTFIDIRSFGFVMLEYLSIRNPDFCIFNFFIHNIHHFFQMFVVWESVFFHIIIPGCLEHPFCNLLFLL